MASVLECFVMSAERFRAVRALIFDLDGTVIDSKSELIRSVNAMLQELRRPQLAAETISGYIGHGAPQLVARALGGTATEEELKFALQFFLAYYEDHKMDSTCAYPEVAETLQRLRHLPMAVLTNKPTRISVRILNALGLAHYFRVVYGGNSFETKKPDPFGAGKNFRGVVGPGNLEGHEAAVRGDDRIGSFAAFVVVEIRESSEIFAGSVELQFPDVDISGAAGTAKLLALTVRFDGSVETVWEDTLDLIVRARRFREIRHHAGAQVDAHDRGLS